MNKTMSKEELVDIIATLYRFEMVLQTTVSQEARQSAEDGMYSLFKLISSLSPLESIANMGIVEETMSRLFSQEATLDNLDELCGLIVNEILAENS